MPTVQTTYIGDLRTEDIHVQSGTKIITDAPTDNQGKGEAFSPTDLLTTSLTTCILTTMAILGKKHGINIDGTTAETTKIMAADPRRVSEIQIRLKFAKEYTDEEKKTLEQIAYNCPVILSLNPELKKTIDFGW